MGLLVTRAFPDERVNGVAFTGNPSDPEDPRWVVTAQAGEESVVRPEPGVLPEKDLLVMEEGRVVEIVRAGASSLVPTGVRVLSDEELEELGALLWHIDRTFPLELQGYERSRVILDVEFKVERGGELAVKQVRPFLLVERGKPTPTFRLEVPAGTVACGGFVPGRGIEDAYALKSTVRFREGPHVLPTRSESFSGELFEEVLLGPGREPAEASAPGFFRLRRIPRGEETRYVFEYSKDYTLPGGERTTLRLSGLDFLGRDEEALDAPRLLDEKVLSLELALEGELETRRVAYASCTFELFPERVIEAETGDGISIRIRERIGPPDLEGWVEPTRLVEAEVDLRGVGRRVTDYWELVFAAERHMRNSRYRVILEPAAEVEGLARPVGAVDLLDPDPMEAGGEQVMLLDEELRPIERAPALTYGRTGFENDFFRRGDVDRNDRMNLTDAVALLEHLFRGLPEPGCADAADTNDDGRLNLTDAVRLLERLFLGAGPLPEPFGPPGDCGVDLTVDDLGCASYPPCRGG